MALEREKAFAMRLTQLRMQAGISARDMSLSMGQSPGYINKIENMQNLPSMCGFFYICDYLKITPMEFFDETLANPRQVKEIEEKLRKLSEKQLAAIEQIIDAMLEPT